jgi:hypothetical protein
VRSFDVRGNQYELSCMTSRAGHDHDPAVESVRGISAHLEPCITVRARRPAAASSDAQPRAPRCGSRSIGAPLRRFHLGLDQSAELEVRLDQLELDENIRFDGDGLPEQLFLACETPRSRGQQFPPSADVVAADYKLWRLGLVNRDGSRSDHGAGRICVVVV